MIFYNVYECGSTDEDTASETVDTSAAGANVLIADGTINNVTGSYVARIYDPDSVVLSEDGMTVEDSEKLHKYDGAFYSKMSMNVDGGEAGTGVLNITADNEGLDTELHLTCLLYTSGPGYARAVKDITAEDANPVGVAHGGCYFSLADTACGSAMALSLIHI